MAHPAMFEKTMQQTNEWLHGLMAETGVSDEKQAYHVLRATLHELRDRMPATEAAHLAANLPTLVRGIYYEAYNPARTPTKEDETEFLVGVLEKMDGADIDAEKATKAVFKLIDAEIPKGEVDDVKNMLPKKLQSYWPN
jgi:uncharacterized protein (DUF2267 family)